MVNKHSLAYTASWGGVIEILESHADRYNNTRGLRRLRQLIDRKISKALPNDRAMLDEIKNHVDSRIVVAERRLEERRRLQETERKEREERQS